MGPFLMPPSPPPPPTKSKPCLLLPILRLLFVFFIPATLSSLALQVIRTVRSIRSQYFDFSGRERSGESCLAQVKQHFKVNLEVVWNNKFLLLRYWNVLSFALVLELLLEKLLFNKKSLALPFNLIKVILILKIFLLLAELFLTSGSYRIVLPFPLT